MKFNDLIKSADVTRFWVGPQDDRDEASRRIWIARMFQIADRLDVLGFPVGPSANLYDCRTWIDDLEAAAQWAQDALSVGDLARTQISEELARGIEPRITAERCGISLLRYYHHLAKWSDEWDAEDETWRVIRIVEQPLL